MRLIPLLLTVCTLLSPIHVYGDVSDTTTAVSSTISNMISIPSSLSISKSTRFKDLIVNIGKAKVDIDIEKEKEKQKQKDGYDVANTIEIEKSFQSKDIIVNIGKLDVDIDIEKEKEKQKEKQKDGYDVAMAPPSTSIEKEFRADDIIINIGKLRVDVDIDKDDKKYDSSKGIVIGSDPIKSTTTTTKPIKSIPSTSTDDTIGDGIDWGDEFSGLDVATEPATDEVVLGENTTDVTVQGNQNEKNDESIVLIGPQIFSVTFKIFKSKVITIEGADLTTSNKPTKKPQKPRELATFIIRGRGFTVGGNQFNSISDFFTQGVNEDDNSGLDATSAILGLSSTTSLLEPKVFLGAIQLKVIKFTDTLIVARFIDLDDQRSFQPGTLLARVKVLRFNNNNKNNKDDHNHDDQNNGNTVLLGGLTLPELGAIGGSLPISSFPSLGVPGDNNNKNNKNNKNSLFTGLEFSTAVLTVSFSVEDAKAIREATPDLDKFFDSNSDY